MKVGVISKGSPDYLIDIVCDGLIKVLGRENVALDYTQKARWGGPYVHLMAGVEQPNSFDIHDADILVASDRSVDAMKQWMNRTGKKNVALVDGEDDPTIRDVGDVKVYFKREYMAGSGYASNVRPLPFAAIPETIPKNTPGLSQAVNPVFFMSSGSNPVRAEINKALEGAGFRQSQALVSKEEYNRRLAGSLVGVSAAGGGWDTYRYWEIPFFGTALLSQRLPIVIPDNFKDGEEAVFFQSIGDFLQKLKGLVNDPARAHAIGAAGHQASLERHLSTHRAKTVLAALS